MVIFSMRFQNLFFMRHQQLKEQTIFIVVLIVKFLFSMVGFLTHLITTTGFIQIFYCPTSYFLTASRQKRVMLVQAFQMSLTAIILQLKKMSHQKKRQRLTLKCSVRYLKISQRSKTANLKAPTILRVRLFIICVSKA